MRNVIDIFTKERIMNATASELLNNKIPSQLEGRSFAISQLAT